MSNRGWRRAGVLLALLLTTLGVVSWLIGSGAPDPPARQAAAPITRTASPKPPAAEQPAGVVKRGAPTAPRSTRASSTSATGEPGLKHNAIYQVRLPAAGNCRARVRRPSPPLRNSALKPYLNTILDCLMHAFSAPLARKGLELARPALRTYHGHLKTPCGALSSSGNPAYYCAGTIYWPVSSDDGRQAYTLARLGYAALLAHEFGHHLQATAGMFDAYSTRFLAGSPAQRNALSRRLELQAQCFEGVFLSQRGALAVSARDQAELRRWHSYTGDEDPAVNRRPDHGTSRAQVRWLERGLDSGDLGRCNTWTADGSAVR